MKLLSLGQIFLLLFILIIGCNTFKKANQVSELKQASTIDLTHWKVTIPTPKDNGKPIEVSPPEILDYANNDLLKEFMYNDSTDGSIVFYAYPAASTGNSSYSRSELREQMVSGSNKTNWTFKDGGQLKATMSVPEISKDAEGKPHRAIIMQIHGVLTDEQRDLIGQKDNNAPPILKIYWDKGKIRVKTKVLKNRKATDREMLETDAWGDDEGYNFEREVGTKKFTLEVIVSDGRMEVILDGRERAVYKDSNIKRWSVFENYFKVGNYLNTRDEGAYARVKVYDLEVSH